MLTEDLQPTDAASVAALIRLAFAAPEVPLVPLPSAVRVSPADIAAHLASGGGGARCGDRACTLWKQDGDALHVSRLAVRPDARRAGLASALLRRAEEEAAAIGARRITLSVRLALIGNRRLFARFGFVEGELHTHPGFDAPTFVDMEKRLW